MKRRKKEKEKEKRERIFRVFEAALKPQSPSYIKNQEQKGQKVK
jgi:hypothetical protein